jgi:hypothetical protein
MKILCITMGPDWPLARAEFERVHIRGVEPFQAIVEDNRVLAFNKSVYECMKLAEDDELWLFEDDVMFDSWPSIHYWPENFLTIHFGANIIGTDTTVWKMPTVFNKNFPLAELHNCWQSHATWYSAECVKYILDNFKYVTDEYKTEGCQIFDEWLRVNVLPMGRSYVLNPMIAYQRPRWSEIWNRDSDYTGCHKQGNEWLKNNL